MDKPNPFYLTADEMDRVSADPAKNPRLAAFVAQSPFARDGDDGRAWLAASAVQKAVGAARAAERERCAVAIGERAGLYEAGSAARDALTRAAEYVRALR